MPVCVFSCVCAKPRASVVCQGASPGDSGDRCGSDSALPGFSVPSRAPRCPTEGDTGNGRTKPHQSAAEGLSGSSLSGHQRAVVTKDQCRPAAQRK